ncbi:MAG: hypothetical protein WD894_13075 [Pirellulales bacterium]
MPRPILREAPWHRLMPSVLYVLSCILAVTCSGCGGEKPGESKVATHPTDSKRDQPATAPSTAKSTEAPKRPSAETRTTEKSADSATPGKAANDAAVADENIQPRTPATVEDARRVLDLTKFPLPAGADVGGGRTIANIKYRAPGDVKSLFEFQRQQLMDQGWKDVPPTHLSETFAQGTFARDGFHVMVTLSPDSTDKRPDWISVSITNFGNVNLSKLPVPPDAKLLPSSPTSVSYVTEKSPAETAEAVHKLLTAQGWEPYDDLADMDTYKQNAIQLHARAVSAATQNGKTMLSYNARQMSADLPAPPKPLRVSYSEYSVTPKELTFETAASLEELYQFYRDKLAQAGWKATTDNPITDESKAFIVFRNPAKEMLTLETRQYADKINGTLQHQSVDELAEIERLIELDRPRLEKELAETRKKEEAENRKKEELAEKKRQEDEKRRVKVAIIVPADAKAVKFEADQIGFQVPRGKARAAADVIRKRIRDAGWKEKKIIEEPVTGSYTFENNEFDDQRITLTYVDPGVFPAEVMVAGFGVGFEKAAAGKK